MSDDMKKVLVIEDNETNIYLMRTIVEKLGHQVIEARDGIEGVELAISKEPDLILMDIQMPKTNGIDAMKEIKKTDGLKHIPIIAYTAFAMKGDREKLILDGFDDYLEKPVTISNLVKLVDRHLDNNNL